MFCLKVSETKTEEEFRTVFVIAPPAIRTACPYLLMVHGQTLGYLHIDTPDGPCMNP